MSIRADHPISSPKPASRHPRVVVVGPTHSRGGITSVICAHSEMETWDAFHCVKLNTFTDGGPLAKLLTALRAYLGAPLLFSRCSLVHVHLAGRSSMLRKLPFLCLAKLLRKQTIVHVHAPSMAALTGSRPRSLFPLVCRLADRILALSPWWAQQFRDMGVTAPIDVIANPVLIPPLPTPLARPQDPQVLFVGKLEPRKGYADLIRAAALILPAAPQTRFVFAGHGQIDEARSLARQLGIEQSICFKGWQSGEALQALYREATVFCLPSYDEGLPMSVLEAMSWALPIVTTPVGGIPDVIRHQVNGLLIPPGDIAQLASQILALLQQSPAERARLGLAAREKVAERCSLERVSEELARIYDHLLSTPSEPLRQALSQ